MGTVKMLSILLCLPALLTAETIHRSLQVEEGGTSYTQTITFDFDNRLQIIDVPAHHNIVYSRSHFYFNQGKVVESHPDRGNCYVKPLPVGIAPMEKLASVLGKRKASPIQARRRVWCTGPLPHLGELLSVRSVIFRRRTQSARVLVSMLWSKFPALSIPTRQLLMHQLTPWRKFKDL